MASKLFLVVTGDYNDADYVTAVTKITAKELEKYTPLIAAIKDFKPYKAKSESGHEWTHDSNWPVGEYGCRKDLGEKSITELYGEPAEEFNALFVPNGGEQSGYSLHSIEDIYTVRLEKELLGHA